MNLEEIVQLAILNKYYGNMLTNRQQDILKMYADSNLSLQEISDELNISRQAVKDALDTSIQTLNQIEQKLKFIARDKKIKVVLEEFDNEKIKQQILSILEDN